MLGLAGGGLAVAVEDVLEGELALGGVGRGGGRRGGEVGAVGGGDVRGAVETWALLAAEAGGEAPDFRGGRGGRGGGEGGCGGG